MHNITSQAVRPPGCTALYIHSDGSFIIKHYYFNDKIILYMEDKKRQTDFYGCFQSMELKPALQDNYIIIPLVKHKQRTKARVSAFIVAYYEDIKKGLL